MKTVFREVANQFEDQIAGKGCEEQRLWSAFSAALFSRLRYFTEDPGNGTRSSASDKPGEPVASTPCNCPFGVRLKHKQQPSVVSFEAVLAIGKYLEVLG